MGHWGEILGSQGGPGKDAEPQGGVCFWKACRLLLSSTLLGSRCPPSRSLGPPLSSSGFQDARVETPEPRGPQMCLVAPSTTTFRGSRLWPPLPCSTLCRDPVLCCVFHACVHTWAGPRCQKEKH